MAIAQPMVAWLVDAAGAVGFGVGSISPSAQAAQFDVNAP